MLTDVGERPREGVCKYNDERCACDLCSRVEIRIDASVGQEEDEDRHADQPAADADECSERPDKESEHEKKQNIHPHNNPPKMIDVFAHYTTKEVLDKGRQL